MTNNFNSYKKLLAKFVGFKSISTNPKYLPEIGKTVAWLKNLFTESGFSVKIWEGKECNPVVFAGLTVNRFLPTLVIYGHYDVQPAGMKDGWKTDPFTLKEGKGKLFGRGVVDNKGQILAHIVTVLTLMKEAKLNYNTKFLIEGNEETSNPDLASIMKTHKKDLACDIVMVSDGELTNNKPTIEISLRGGFNCTLTYQTGKNNLHSGIFGGAVPNAAIELSRFLAKIHNPDNTIGYPEFYKKADAISPKQLKNNKNLTDGGSIRELAGVDTLITEKGHDFYTQTGLRPTIQITGINTGYIETGYANIVPAKAEARLNFRIVASQKPEQVAKDFEKFVRKNTPKYVKAGLSFHGLHSPIKLDMENKYVERATTVLKKVYGSKVSRKNVGGAVPFVADVKDILGVDTLLIPLVNEDSNMHGANENFDIELAKKALEFSRAFLSAD